MLWERPGFHSLRLLHFPPFHKLPWRQEVHAWVRASPPVQLGQLELCVAFPVWLEFLPLFGDCIKLRQPLVPHEWGHTEAANAFGRRRLAHVPKASQHELFREWSARATKLEVSQHPVDDLPVSLQLLALTRLGVQEV